MVESDREDKKSRVEDAMMEKIAHETNNQASQKADIMEGGRAPDQSDFPFSATMSQDGSRLSSLSGEEEGSNSDESDDEGEGEGEAPDSTGGGGVPLKRGSNMRMKRQISHDESMSNSNSSSAENRQSSITGGNWGWFEDVHGHESAFLPGFSAASGGESLEKGGGSKERKKSGIWKMGSDLMQSALSAIVEPQRQGKSQPGNCFIFFRQCCFFFGGSFAIYLARCDVIAAV